MWNAKLQCLKDMADAKVDLRRNQHLLRASQERVRIREEVTAAKAAEASPAAGADPAVAQAQKA